jgi:small GTP-binding protein
MSGNVGEVKVVIVGATSVGKTCIVKRAATGNFDSSVTPTLGASYTSKLVTVGDSLTRLLIWDTAGQERYRGITPMYYRNAIGAIIVYSMVEPQSFNDVERWADSLEESAPGVVKFLVANKCDLDARRQVSAEQGQQKGAAIGATFSEVSAKTGFGIDELFMTIGAACIERQKERAQEKADAARARAVTLTAPPRGKTTQKKGWC